MMKQLRKLRESKKAVIGSFTVDFWVIVGIVALLIIYIVACFFIKTGKGINVGIYIDKETEQTEILGRILNIKPFFNYAFSYTGLFLGNEVNLIGALISFEDKDKGEMEGYLKELIQSYGNGFLTIMKGNTYIYCAKVGIRDVNCKSKQYKNEEEKNKIYGLRSGTYIDFYFPGFRITNVDEYLLRVPKSEDPSNAWGGTS